MLLVLAMITLVVVCGYLSLALANTWAFMHGYDVIDVEL